MLLRRNRLAEKGPDRLRLGNRSKWLGRGSGSARLLRWGCLLLLLLLSHGR